MTYTQNGDNVTLEMTRDDYDRLMLMLGFACGAAMRVNDKAQFYRWLEFTNGLNHGNPNFTPYQIPEEYRQSRQGVHIVEKGGQG